MFRYDITPEDYLVAEKNGLDKKLVNQRVKERFYDVDRAITEPKQNKTSYGALVKLAEKNGISANTFYQRIHTQKMTPEEAATKPLSRKKRRAK